MSILIHPEDLVLDQEYKYNVVAMYTDGCSATSDSILTPVSGDQ